MHSTSKVTWSESTSATVRGNVIIGSGRTGASRPTNRYTRFIHRDGHVGHGPDPDSTGAPTATQPADMPRRDGACEHERRKRDEKGMAVLWTAVLHGRWRFVGPPEPSCGRRL